MSGSLYTKSAFFRTVFLLVIALFGLTFKAQAQIVAPSFKVENISVDVTASSAVAAREKAFDAAQIKAYEKLARQHLSEEAMTQFSVPPLARISALMQSFEVSNEQVSATRYRGTYEMTFKPHQIAPELAGMSRPAMNGQSALPASDVGGTYPDRNPRDVPANVISATTLIIPVLEQNGRRMIWMNNAYRDAFKGAMAGKGSFLLPDGTADDRAAVRDDENINYDPARLRRLQNKYNAQETIFVLAKLADQSNVPAQISYYRAGPQGASLINQQQVDIRNDDTAQSLSSRIAEQAVGGLAQFEPAAPTSKLATASNPGFTTTDMALPPATGPLNQAFILVDYSSVRDWLSKKRLIESTPGIGGLQVTAMNARQATASLSYRGDVNLLEQNLRRKGLRLTALPQGQRGAAQYVVQQL
jgi:hypothetical protein